MNKILGKIIISTLMMCALFLDAKVTMQVMTSDGRPLECAAVGQPFTLEVMVDEVQGSIPSPIIERLEQFNGRRTGMYMSSINGVSSTKFTYFVRVDQPGTYTIGPAHIKHHNGELVSAALTVHVEKEGAQAHASNGGKSAAKHAAQQQAAAKAFVRLSVDKESVYVGEKITGILRFFYQDASTKLAHIGQPEIQGFDMKQINAPKGGVMDIHGTHYRYAEWQWEMYPNANGEYVIPAYSADYEIPTKNNNGLGSFFMFFTAPPERKRVYSNAVKITVRPLPYYDGIVDAVGVFESMTATIKPPMAKQGEGMVFSLELEGDCNWDAIKTMPLTMPKELKYYTSQTSYDAPIDQEGMAKTRFEFIVQGLHAGDWEIPAQQFTFFDVQDHIYKTLHTAPVAVSITPHAQMHTTVNNDVQSKNDEQAHGQMHGADTADKHRTDIMILPINVDGPWYPVTERTSLPWIVVHLLLILPVVAISLPSVKRRLSVVGGPKRHAFRKARKKLKECEDKLDASQLYPLFMTLCTELCQHYYQEISCETVVLNIEMRLSDDMRTEWHDFWTNITQEAFGVFNKKNNTHQLCRAAKQWLDRLEKIM